MSGAPLAVLPPALRAVVSAVLLGLNTVFWTLLLVPLGLVRLVLPWRAVRRRIDPVLNAIATTWVSGNGAWMHLVQRHHWQVQGGADLPYAGWYLVVCNHQSWVDIFVLQQVFNRRIPMLKFFLKQQLIWVPVIGLAWWALDFPFMRRHSDAVLRRHPEKRQQDIDATRQACAKFALVPTSVMNFVEGTRFTAAKHAQQGSPFQHLLSPKAGGLATALAVLGERFDSLVDVTIVYPDGVPTFGQLLRGQVGRVLVQVQRHDIPADCRGSDGTLSSPFRKTVQRWLLGLWQAKDERIGQLLQAARRSADG